MFAEVKEYAFLILLKQPSSHDCVLDQSYFF